jgi:hypothetical protein
MVSRQRAVRIGPDDDLRGSLALALTQAVIDLAGG